MKKFLDRFKSPIDIKIAEAEQELLTCSKEEVDSKLQNLERLYAVKKELKPGLSQDTKALIIANLVGIVLIMTYEQTNVISTKALGFVQKGRV